VSDQPAESVAALPKPTGLVRVVWAIVSFAVGVILIACIPPIAPLQIITTLTILGGSGLVAGAYLAAAAGLGWPITRLLGIDRMTRVDRYLCQLALGGLALMLIDWLAALAGLFNPATAWLIGLVGWGLLIGQLIRRRLDLSQSILPSKVRWPNLAGALGAGLMFGAATVAPGGLWPSEFGGYDVLGYHLQLPREWMSLGRMVGLEHNAYAYLPNLFEVAYWHLGLWIGSMVEAAYACQILHGMTAVLAAAGIGRAVLHLGRSVNRPRDGKLTERLPFAASFAGAIYLLAPWVIVTGSLAYNEQAAMWLGATALVLALIHVRRASSSAGATAAYRHILGTGLLLGGAMLCKPTLGLMLAPAVGLVLVMRLRAGPAIAGRQRAFWLLTWMAGVVTMAGLWWIRNAVWTGNPLFPMLADQLGSGHWTAEQAARWAAAHRPPPLGQWPERFVDQLVGHFQFAMAVIPAAIVGLMIIYQRRNARLTTWLISMAWVGQLLVWLLITHQQSRFALAMFLPICLSIGLGWWLIDHPLAARGLVGVVLLPQLLVILVVYGLSSTQGMPRPLLIGGVDLLARPNYRPVPGAAPLPNERSVYATLNALPDGANVYTEGFAVPFYVNTPLSYHTVWDPSPLGRLIEQHRGEVGPALDQLQNHGYTHLLVDRQMILGVWLSEGNYGYDPAITAARLEQIDRSPLTLPIVGSNQAPWVLYQLIQPPAPTPLP
jgi:uncharacterized membrane protein YbaN (DUF454 family)